MDPRVAYILGGCVVFLLVFFIICLVLNGRLNSTLPGPLPFPILGSLHLLGKHPSPFESLTALSENYGPIYRLTLGTCQCVVVSSFPLIKEVLITKGGDFGGRPDFLRFHKLFGGDRNNSLALCDWSDLQKTRRGIARMYCSPRLPSLNYMKISAVGAEEIEQFCAELSQKNLIDFDLKPMIMAACANMFCGYMTSTRFSYKDAAFLNMVHLFDEIFWEINQGYAVDFLPWLELLYINHMKKLTSWSQDIRQFILTRIVDQHMATLDKMQPPRDFTDALLMQLQNDAGLTWHHIIYELEDFIGGHSAIGNLVMLALGYIVLHPAVAKRIQEEIDRTTGGNRDVLLTDKPSMPFTEATLLETLRVTSSPIVPHVASNKTSIAGHTIEKDTIIFINNYKLNTGSAYWEKPEQFSPERFIQNDKIHKPDHFIPFSTGKRTCIGQRLVQGISFMLLACILQRYDVLGDANKITIFPACVALPPTTFRLTLRPRKTQLF